MSKDPAFLFYPGDWLGGTLGMTFELKGAYMELLMLQFNTGHMTYDMIAHVVGQLWDKLQVKFKKDENGLWYNVRLEEEVEKRKYFVNSRKNNLLGINQYSKLPPKEENIEGHMVAHTSSRMENEDENENTIEKRKLKFREKVNELFNGKQPQATLNDFFDYWTEHNEGGKKMRFEMQKVFNIQRRMGTWTKNNFNKQVVSEPTRKFKNA